MIENDFPGDGSSFSGQIQSGERIGEGVCKYSDGAIYEGTFLHGKREGEGVCVWPTGGRYVGLWRDDRPWGGEMEECPYFGAGSIYSGVVGGGRQHGQGRCEYATNDVYEGSWCAGMRHGKGLYKDHKGGVFEGKFKQNHPWEGTMSNFAYENGDSYHGTWSQGMQDQGAFKRADGHGFVGKFVNNLPFEGVYTRPHNPESGPSTPSISLQSSRRNSLKSVKSEEMTEHHSRLHEERALRSLGQSPGKLTGVSSPSLAGSPGGALRRERRNSRDSTASGGTVGSRVSFREL